MQTQKKILEKDLFNPVQEYFSNLGFSVHGEVKLCDITASKGDDLIIIELKRSLNLDLLIQAAKRQRITEKVYVAIPKPNFSMFSRKWRDLCFIVRRLELGLITVSFKDDTDMVKVIMEPSPFDRQKSMQRHKTKRKSITGEIEGRHGNFNIGGSMGTKLMTVYKENSIHIACCLKKFGQMSPRKLRELGTGDKTLSILNKNFYKWFERVEKGVYRLSTHGNEVLQKYPQLVSYYEEKINNIEFEAGYKPNNE